MQSERDEIIGTQHKFSCVAISAGSTERMSEPLRLAPGLCVVSQPPVDLDADLRTRLGEERVERYEKASLFLVATRPSHRPEVLDLESRALEIRAERALVGLAMATPGFSMQTAMSVTGARLDGRWSIRKIGGQWPGLFPAPCSPSHWGVTTHHLIQAARVVDGLRATAPRGQFGRLARVNQAFIAGLSSRRLVDRLHQFVRCLEGLILPIQSDQGTTSTFKERVTWMLADKHRMDLVRDLYVMRGKIEHLHGSETAVLSVRPDLAGRRRELIEHLAYATFAAEMIARVCLLRIYTREKLWPHFRSDESLGRFWTEKLRRDRWGQTPLAPEFDRAMAAFDKRVAARMAEDQGFEDEADRKADEMLNEDPLTPPVPEPDFGPRVTG